MLQRRWVIFGNRKPEELRLHSTQLVGILLLVRKLELTTSSGRRRANFRASNWSSLNRKSSPRLALDRIYRVDLGVCHSGDVRLRTARNLRPSSSQEKSPAS